MPRILTRHLLRLTTLAAFRATTALHRASVRSVSMSAMDGVAPWRERITDSIARSRKIRGGNYVQLATVDSDTPRCRTVVFRGFAPDGRLKIITDKRSAKVTESRRVEVCWWFSQSSEQYRSRATLPTSGATLMMTTSPCASSSGATCRTRRASSSSGRTPAETFDAAPGRAAGGRDAGGRGAAGARCSCWGWSRPTPSTI